MISIAAKSYPDTVAENPSAFARRTTALCLAALLGAVPFCEALAAKSSGSIPPNLAQQLALQAKQIAAKTQKQAAVASSSRSSATPNAATKAQAAQKVARVAKTVTSDIARATSATINKPSRGDAFARAPTARTSAGQPADPRRASLVNKGLLSGPIPRTPSDQRNGAATNSATSMASAINSATKQTQGALANAAVAAKERKAADTPARSTAGARAKAPMADTKPVKAAANSGPTYDRLVKTEYVKGSDGHVITYQYYRQPDGSLLTTAISPAASPPPNASKPQAGPSSTHQTDRAVVTSPASPVQGETQTKTAVAPGMGLKDRPSNESGEGALQGRDMSARTVQAQPRADAHSTATSGTSGAGQAANDAGADRRRDDPKPFVASLSPGANIKSGEIASGTSDARKDSITVTLPDSTAADSDRAAALPARQTRQGMDVVDRTIGEFDATRPAAAGLTDERKADWSATAGDAPAAGHAGTAKPPTTHVESGTQADADAMQSRRGGVVDPGKAVQSGEGDQVGPRNRRTRQARSSGSHTAPATGKNKAQPLLFGGVTRGSFALARMQGPNTATRGVHIPMTATTADASSRPGAVSSRGVAQVADLGRGSPAYGAAPDVFASSGGSPKSASVACKPRASARYTAQRHKANTRATACS